MRKVLLISLSLLVASAYAEVAFGDGMWLDGIEFVLYDDAETALRHLSEGELHLIAAPLDSRADVQLAVGLGLQSRVSQSARDELFLNYAGPCFNDGRLNPFSIPQVRQAISLLIDRQSICDEFTGGAVPKWTFTNTAFGVMGPLHPLVSDIEQAYAHNPERAVALLEEGMRSVSAEKVDGKWMHGGRRVLVKGLIRVEDERMGFGNYVADLLEGQGFNVERIYCRYQDAIPIWVNSPPFDGEWSYYTGGWARVTAPISDLSFLMPTFYFEDVVQDAGNDQWLSFATRGPFTDDRLEEVCRKLYEGSYETTDAFYALVEEAEQLASDDSSHVWLCNLQDHWYHSPDVAFIADTAVGLESPAWPRSLCLLDDNCAPVQGGNVEVALVDSDGLVGLWGNPFRSQYRTSPLSWATAATPTYESNGTHSPGALVRAELLVRDDMAISSGLGWISIDRVTRVGVPSDAWADWDALAQEFVTTGERFGDDVVADVRATLRFEEDLWQRQWHDGSCLSIGDLLTALALKLDTQKPESPLYSQDTVDKYGSMLEGLRGFRLVSVEPLVIEIYANTRHVRAGDLVSEVAQYAWPSYSGGQAPWHVVSLAILADFAMKTGLGPDRAQQLGVEELDLLQGPVPESLYNQLAWVQHTGHVPFSSALGQYVDKEEACDRYGGLSDFYQKHGHMWVGLGPLMIEQVDVSGGRITSVAFDGFADPKLSP